MIGGLLIGCGILIFVAAAMLGLALFGEEPGFVVATAVAIGFAGLGVAAVSIGAGML